MSKPPAKLPTLGRLGNITPDMIVAEGMTFRIRELRARRSKHPDRFVEKLLTPELIIEIAEGVEAGAFPWVAAMKCGVPKPCFEAWMAVGKKIAERRYNERLKKDEYRVVDLYLTVQQARGLARVRVESDVSVNHPTTWLTKGPGKDRPGEEGWNELSKVELTGRDGGPMQTVHSALDLSKLSSDELDALDKLTEKASAELPEDAEFAGDGTSGEGAP